MWFVQKCASRVIPPAIDNRQVMEVDKEIIHLQLVDIIYYYIYLTSIGGLNHMICSRC